ncbi:hypothetical protein L9F63_023888 [Diploptera punctata]|uniref:Ecdysis triggering hormone n=1 Tax=Diploptera punctata TaxID=6984 RepID=A0AAD7ZI62_DIPPU|nr:hypothetical protein L9F63_023888 [Diploptera punctata]
MSKYSLSHWMLVAVGTGIMVIISTITGEVSGEESGGTNFFLKASKSVPRIGRRSEYDNFYLKASKSVPRIGRRRELSPLTDGREWANVPWFRTSDNIPGPSRRSDYNNHEEGHPSQLVSWNEIEKAMEMNPDIWNPDLWRKNSQFYPMRDEYDIPHVTRRSIGPDNNEKRAVEDSRNQAEH